MQLCLQGIAGPWEWSAWEHDAEPHEGVDREAACGGRLCSCREQEEADRFVAVEGPSCKVWEEPLCTPEGASHQI